VHLVLTLWEQRRGTFAATGPGLHHLSFQVDAVERIREMALALSRYSYDEYSPVNPVAARDPSIHLWS
jgi:hypothetical protein